VDFDSVKVLFHTGTRIPYILNPAAADIWDFCSRPRKLDDIIRYLAEEYGIGMATAKKDAVKFINELEKRKLVEFE
jgi:hypothetical protein